MHIIDRLDVDFQTAAVISRKLSFWSLILKDELTNMPVSYNNGNDVLDSIYYIKLNLSCVTVL
jgi:hypothetical protein